MAGEVSPATVARSTELHDSGSTGSPALQAGLDAVGRMVATSQEMLDAVMGLLNTSKEVLALVKLTYGDDEPSTLAMALRSVADRLDPPALCKGDTPWTAAALAAIRTSRHELGNDGTDAMDADDVLASSQWAATVTQVLSRDLMPLFDKVDAESEAKYREALVDMAEVVLSWLESHLRKVALVNQLAANPELAA
jgi:hypothetical protein